MRGLLKNSKCYSQWAVGIGMSKTLRIIGIVKVSTNWDKMHIMTSEEM